MKRSVFVLSAILATGLSGRAASVQTARPEQNGFSSERLTRIHEMVQRHMDAHDISGAVTLVARNGKLVHLEAHGLADMESKKPMSKDSLFWIMSMTKPVVGTSVLMMMEQGKLRLTDPISTFIPAFKGMKVAVIQDRPGRGAGTHSSHGTPFLHCARNPRDYNSGPVDARLGSQQRRTGKQRRSGEDWAQSR